MAEAGKPQHLSDVGSSNTIYDNVINVVMARINRRKLHVCQFTGDEGCSVECVAKGYSHGGHCDSSQVCVCNPS